MPLTVWMYLGTRGSSSTFLRRRVICNSSVQLLLAAWWVGGYAVQNNPATTAFADFAPEPALTRLGEMLSSGEAMQMTVPSLQRVLQGMVIAIAIGVPVGILVGRFQVLREVTNIPFQFLRMISPLSWMPIAVRTRFARKRATNENTTVSLTASPTLLGPPVTARPR